MTKKTMRLPIFCEDNILVYLFSYTCLQQIQTPLYALMVMNSFNTCHENTLNATKLVQSSDADTVSLQNHQEQTEPQSNSFRCVHVAVAQISYLKNC